MGPNFEREGKSSNGIEVSATEQNNGSMLQGPQNMLTNGGNNTGYNTFHVGPFVDGKAKVKNGDKDMEVDIPEFTKSGGHGLAEAECQNSTENSSSFGDTMSGSENISALNDIDVEVESPFCVGNAWAPALDVYNEALPVRKKKLTDHWRRFIRPIMWRCKWTELQIKKSQSQVLRYYKELAEYDKRKQFEFEESTLEGLDTQVPPFSCQNRKNQFMKRKKRKRVEETTDLASYMSSHSLFSYYEFKRSTANGANKDNDFGNLDNKTASSNDGFGFNDGWPSLEFSDSDNSLGQMLSKIELVQSQVSKLKTQIDKVVSENSGKFSSINRLSLLVPCDALTSPDPNAASRKSGHEMPDGSLYIALPNISEFNMEDLMPESAVSHHGEVTLPRDSFRSTGQLQVKDLCENNKEGILIHNQASDKELHNFERIISQLTEKPQASTRKLDAIPLQEAQKAGMPTKISVPHDQPSNSRSNVCDNNGKWGSQKSRSGRCTRRSSG